MNGVDPLRHEYTDGVFPGSDSSHPLSNVTFKWLNLGDYPIWSALRIVSQSPPPFGVESLILAAQALNSSQYNFISPTNLQIWHSYYFLPTLASGVAALGNSMANPNDLVQRPALSRNPAATSVVQPPSSRSTLISA